MNPLELIDDIIDWVMYWRFNLCFFGGIALGVLCMAGSPEGVLQWIALGFWVITGTIAGWVWQSRSG